MQYSVYPPDPQLWFLVQPCSPLPTVLGRWVQGRLAVHSGLLLWWILELSLSRDHPVSCWNWFSVQRSFPTIHSFGVRAALSEKSRTFSFGDISESSLVVCLHEQPARQCSKVVTRQTLAVLRGHPPGTGLHWVLAPGLEVQVVLSLVLTHNL